MSIQWAYYSVIERNQLFIYAVTWVSLRISMLSERIKTQKITYFMFSFTWNFRKVIIPAPHNHRPAFCPYYLRESRSVITWNLVWQKEVLSREKWKPLRLVKMSWVSNMTVVSQVYASSKTRQFAHLNGMYLFIFELYLKLILKCV